MRKERIEEIAEMCRVRVYRDVVVFQSVRDVLLSLPEFQEPVWIRCSERMPEVNELIFFVIDPSVCIVPQHHAPIYEGVYTTDTWVGQSPDHKKGNCYCDRHVTHWMPRKTPPLPVTEESDQVKELREYFFTHPGQVVCQEKVIEIVKRWEMKDGKKK